MAVNAAPEEDFGSGEAVLKQVFQPYVCRSIADRGLPHAGDIAEASSLSAIPLPPSDYPLWDSLPAPIVDQGKLSQLQLEGVLYACTRHQQILPSGERAGFFIGDGAGVGKGRQIAGVILDSYVRGRRRHLWLSTSSDLHVDAMRDMRDLGAYIPLINGCAMLDKGTRALGLDKDLQEGVLFLTYSTLISAGRAGKSRMDQVLEWLAGSTGAAAGSAAATNAAAAAAQAWDGVFVLDECHKAKNFTPGKESQSTKVASAVIALQTMLPNARVLYCSATGVSEVGNMAYMARMGLWGPSSPFTDFAAFLESMKKRGVSFMELLAMEMKAAGRYVARGLSFRQAEFLQVEAPLTPEKVQQYDAAVAVWQQLRIKLELALQLAGNDRRDLWKMFWAAQQRFFKLLCIGLKLDTVIAEAKAALESGMCVVIGLQSTGEAAADAMGLEPGPLPGFVSACKELLVRFIQQNFPEHQQQSPEAMASGQPAEAIPACRHMKKQLLHQVASLDLPPNFLDLLIDKLGGPSVVAEMTGRKGRVVREQRRGGVGGVGRVVYELRAKPDSSEMDSLNVTEREAFLAGKKRVALISDAASTGISLHAAQTAANKDQRRLHLTIELPWSADKAIQQLGRSHRTNQVSAPLYKLVVSAAGGERRFAAAVARRLQSLGALTRGDRRAAAGVDLSDSNFDTPWGRKSLRKMYDHIVTESPQLPNGVTVLALLKDLFVMPGSEQEAGAADGEAAMVAVTDADQQQRHQQQQDDTMHLLQQQLPALSALQRLAAAAAAESAKAAATAKQSNVAHTSPAKAAAAAAAAKEAAAEAMVVAALTGKAPLPSAAAAFMTPVQTGAAISELHRELRSCCDMMGIGLAARSNDTVVEDRLRDTTAAGKDATAATPAAKDVGDVRRFLNRLLGLPLGKQNLLFNYFAATLAAEIAAAKAEGRYTEGVSDLHGSSIRLARPPELLWGEAGGVETGAAAQTWVNTLQVDRGVSFEDAVRRLAHESFPGCASGFRRSRRPMFGTHLVLLALQKPGQKNLFSLVRPNTGEAFYDMDRGELDEKYAKAAAEVVEEAWRAQHTASLTSCIHGPMCANKNTCQVGRRLTEVTILSGSVVRVWGVLESILERRALELNKADRTMRVVRVTLGKQQQQQHSPRKQQQQQQQQGSPQRQHELGSPQEQALQQQQQHQQRGSPQQLRQQESMPLEQAPQHHRGLRQQALEECLQQNGSQQQQPRSIELQQQQQQGLSQQQQQQQTSDKQHSSSQLLQGNSQQEQPPAASSPAAAAEQTIVGVRYPAHLLPEVVATLASLHGSSSSHTPLQQQQTLNALWSQQQQQQQQQYSKQYLSQPQQTQQQQKGLVMSGWWAAGVEKHSAAAVGNSKSKSTSLTEALGIARIEPPTPVDRKLQAKAFRAPKTLHNYFQAQGNAKPVAAAAAATTGSAAAAAAADGPFDAADELMIIAATQAPTHVNAQSAVHLASKGGSSSSSKGSAAAAAAATAVKKAQGSKEQPAVRNTLTSFFKRAAGTVAAAAAVGGGNPQQQLPPAKKQKLGLQQQQQKQTANTKAASCSVILIDSETECDVESAAVPSAIRPAADSVANGASTAAAASVGGVGGNDRTAGRFFTNSNGKRSPSRATHPQAAAQAAAEADTAIQRRSKQRKTQQHGTADSERDGGSSSGSMMSSHSTDNETADQQHGSASDADYCPDEDEGLAEMQRVDKHAAAQQRKQQQQQQQSATGSRAAAKGAPAAPASVTAAHVVAVNSFKKQQKQLGKQSKQDKLQLLAGMGFTGMKAERALWVSNGDVDRAIEWCLTFT